MNGEDQLGHERRELGKKLSEIARISQMTVELAKAFKEPVRQIIILNAFLATVRF